MRLLSAIVRNFRLHREVALDFDAARTLIGGPNESGKSTLVEALHRALFLRAKGNTEYHRAMVSTRHGGQPEVDLRFEVNGETIQVRKRFGATGTTTLSRTGAPALQGDAAETELARLLSVPAGITGKGVLGQWSHLWVWQGSSGTDPCEPASAQADRLLSRLQHEGGAVAVRSDRDAQVADSIAAQHEALFTLAGKPKVGTDLERAEAAAAEASMQLERATERRRILMQSVRDFEDATGELRRLDADLPALSARKRAILQRGTQITELRTREAVERAASESISERLRGLLAAGTRIAELQRLVGERESSLRPATGRACELAEAHQTARARAEQAEHALQTAQEGTRKQRQVRDRLHAADNRWEKAARRDELASRDTQVRQYREDAARLKELMARLPALEPTRLRQLQDLERTATATEATWKAMAAGLEVVASDGPVLAGGEALQPGESRILTEETEVTVGTSLHLRIRPGGGTGLIEARAQARTAQAHFQRELDALGLATLGDAQDAVSRRAGLAHQLEATGHLLKSLDADRLPQQLAEADDALAAADAEWKRRSEGSEDGTFPNDGPGTRLALFGAEEILRALEHAETRRQAERDAAVRSATDAAEALARHQEAMDRQNREVGEWQGQLRLLRELHGDDESRTATTATAKADSLAADGLLTQTRLALAALQPELLAADTARLDRALENATCLRADAAQRYAVAQAALQLDGTEDPESDWALAAARAATAAEHLAGVRTRAHAIRLLHQLFVEQQQALADRFTRPLADRIAGYLQCLFGPGARAAVTLSEGAFRGLQLVRPDFPEGTIPFDALSGGTREQVAAAVRLALAEILAADHGGTLPVIFDDAFAFSDPDRVQTLQRMIDLAAVRGLQVIVLTCAPSDYAALGARQIRLTAPTPSPAQAS